MNPLINSRAEWPRLQSPRWTTPSDRHFHAGRLSTTTDAFVAADAFDTCQVYAEIAISEIDDSERRGGSAASLPLRVGSGRPMALCTPLTVRSFRSRRRAVPEGDGAVPQPELGAAAAHEPPPPADAGRSGPSSRTCTFPVPSLYLPCTFPVPSWTAAGAGPRPQSWWTR